MASSRTFTPVLRPLPLAPVTADLTAALAGPSPAALPVSSAQQHSISHSSHKHTLGSLGKTSASRLGPASAQHQLSTVQQQQGIISAAVRHQNINVVSALYQLSINVLSAQHQLSVCSDSQRPVQTGSIDVARSHRVGVSSAASERLASRDRPAFLALGRDELHATPVRNEVCRRTCAPRREAWAC